MRRRTVLYCLAAAPFAVGAEDDLLEDLSRRCFQFFWEQADPSTGLVLDRARNDGTREPRAPNIATIAATGFGLTVLCIAVERQWIGRDQALERVRNTLGTFTSKAQNKEGWFFHFLDATSSDRAWNCELSSIDTALLLAGVLTVRQYFSEPDIRDAATAIYNRVNFQWMLNGDRLLLSHGWKPESGFLRSRWAKISEAHILYLMAIGSTAHPIPPESWYAWERPVVHYAGLTYVSDAPLFTHQYSQAWIDFRGLRDRPPSNINYFDNSIAATRANRAFCLDLAKTFPKSYSEQIWGISASDGANGYFAWGNPPDRTNIDGTVVPYASAGSMMFLRDLCLPVLQAMKTRFGDRIWGRYGFADAFNPTTGWVDQDVLGIDLGITLLGIENARSGNVWSWFMRNPEIRKAMQDAGFRKA